MVNSTATNLSAKRDIRRAGRRAGFTIVELIITLGIFMVVCGMAVPALLSAISAAKIARATADVRTIGNEAYGYFAQYGDVPNSLIDIGYDQQLDPWGHSYVYLGITSSVNSSQLRTDRFGVPVNTFFDLYSLGADGQSALSMGDPKSQDDLVWADDGQFIGLGANY
jgi:general secretion pathway protein G